MSWSESQRKPCAQCGDPKPAGAGRRICPRCVETNRIERTTRLRTDPAHVAANRQRATEWRLKNPERFKALQRRCSLKRKYGITVEQFDSMRRSQHDACAMCQEPFNELPNVDHDHNCCPGRKTCGACIRGLLCSSCNRAVGFYEKYGDLAAAYLNRRNARAVA